MAVLLCFAIDTVWSLCIVTLGQDVHYQQDHQLEKKGEKKA